MASDATSERAPAFGQEFTDHMVVASYRAASGWSDAELVPFGALSLSPAAMVFHYGQAIFEGLKAFRQPDGGMAMFRPRDHAARFERSADRMAMPRLPCDRFVDACARLVAVDHHRAPAGPEGALYLRPMMIATEAALGVRAADEYLFAVIASPAAAYFSGEMQPITVWASGEHVRAAPGGTGFAKCAGNYGGSLAAKQEALARECDETLWLDAVEHRWVEEMGGMNIVLVEHGERSPRLVTPPGGDTILDGVTRRSILELAPRLGLEAVERPVAIDELSERGRFDEAFACGTAAVVVPIGAVRSPYLDVTIGDGRSGRVTVRLRETLTAIRHGRAADPFGWLVGADAAVPA